MAASRALCFFGVFTAAFAKEVLIQVRMGPFVSCSGLSTDKQAELEEFIKQVIVNSTRDYCSGCINSTHLSTLSLLCYPLDPNFPTYRGYIVGDSVDRISGAVEAWVQSEEPVSYGFVSLSVDSNCPVYPDSTNAEGCKDATETLTVAVLVGALVAELLVLFVIFLTVLGGVVWFFSSRHTKLHRELKRRKSHRKLKSTQSHESFKKGEEMTMHSCEAYATAT